MPERKILVNTEHEQLIVTVPDSWKVTFGPFFPSGNRVYESGNALRIYETKDKQRACFRNVLSFRDLSLEVKSRPHTVELDGKSVKLTQTEHMSDDEFTPVGVPFLGE